MALTKLEMTP